MPDLSASNSVVAKIPHRTLTERSHEQCANSGKSQMCVGFVFNGRSFPLTCLSEDHFRLDLSWLQEYIRTLALGGVLQGGAGAGSLVESHPEALRDSDRVPKALERPAATLVFVVGKLGLTLVRSSKRRTALALSLHQHLINDNFLGSWDFSLSSGAGQAAIEKKALVLSRRVVGGDASTRTTCM